MASTAIKRVAGQFRVAIIGEGNCTLESFNRRDFYKISLVTQGSPYRLRYGSLDEIECDRPALILLSPIVPYAWTIPEPAVEAGGSTVGAGGRAVEAGGYFCVFNHEFIRSSPQLSSVAARLYTPYESPVYFPDPGAQQFLTELFARMRAEVDMDYTDKDDLFRSHLSLIFQEATLMRRIGDGADKGAHRVAGQFIRLLNSQFPVDLPLQPITLKKAADFADRIAVHVNHLNAEVQKATGKSTTEHINERLFAEAKSLLGHTDYSVAEIALGLGFDYQSYFNRFFKKHAGVTPSEFRKNFEKYK
jgi:AraC family transcriptional regulator, transcriptional activator of pobA